MSDLPQPTKEMLYELVTVENTMGAPPGWITRWGIASILTFVLICLGVTAVIHFPDVINAEAIVYTTHPPIEIYPVKSGEMAELLVSNKQRVVAQQPLFVLNSTGHWRDVLLADSLLNIDADAGYKLPDNLRLGDMSNAYQEVLLSRSNYYQVLARDITTLKIKSIETEIIQINQLNENIGRQGQLLAEEVRIAENNLNRTKKLFSDGVNSQQDVEAIELVFLKVKRQLEQSQGEMVNHRIRINQLQTQMADLRKNQHESYDNLRSTLSQKTAALRSLVAQWKRQYLVLAPASGIVSMPNQLTRGSFMPAEHSVLSIVPPEHVAGSRAIVKARILTIGAGKVELGQRATVYFDNFPASEYGTIDATVTDISLIPREKFYTVTLELPAEWKTSYGKMIPRQQDLAASVAIKTKDYTILQRLFIGLRNSISGAPSS